LQRADNAVDRADTASRLGAQNSVTRRAFAALTSDLIRSAPAGADLKIEIGEGE